MARSKVNNSGTAKAKTKKISVILQINKTGIAEARTKTISVILQKNYSGTGKAMTTRISEILQENCIRYLDACCSHQSGFRQESVSN